MTDPIRCPLCGEENPANQWLVDAGPADSAVEQNPSLFFLDRAIGAAIRTWHKWGKR